MTWVGFKLKCVVPILVSPCFSDHPEWEVRFFKVRVFYVRGSFRKLLVSVRRRDSLFYLTL